MIPLFEDVIGKTCALVQAALPSLQEVILIRDLQGKVHLIFKFPTDPEGREILPNDYGTTVEQLRQDLTQALDAYWGGSIWRKKKGLEEKLVAEAERQSAPFAGPSGSAVTWKIVERQLSKTAWLRRKTPPWAQAPDAPAIVSFFSFKGGVGRTTALTAAALCLAAAGKKVCVIDLDIEAPGVGALMGSPSAWNLVNYLTECQVLGRRPDWSLLDVPTVDAALTGDGSIRVLPAGDLDGRYLEKISRLDFEGYVRMNSAEHPLSVLLTHIREELNPDFILMDCRSGLHDIGGLSLNGLSHLDVLFAMDTPQNWDGLALLLRLLAPESGQAPPNFMLVHAMAMTKHNAGAHDDFRNRAYDILSEEYFSDETVVPSIDDPLYGTPIPHRDDLVQISALQAVLDDLRGKPYRDLVDRMSVLVEKVL